VDKFDDKINTYLKKYFIPEVLSNELLASIETNLTSQPSEDQEFPAE